MSPSATRVAMKRCAVGVIVLSWRARRYQEGIVRQAVAIWLHAIPRDKRALLLERIGYQAQRQPGRPRRDTQYANSSE